MRKIVDENGKLFGKVNLLDLLVFLLIAVALIGGVYKLFFVDNTVYLPDYKNGHITLKISDLSERDTTALSEGDLVSVLGVQDLGTISSVEIRHKMKNASSSDGNVYTVEDPLVYEAIIVLDATQLFENNGFTYVGQNYKLNSGMTVGVSNGLLPCSAYVVDIEILK